MIAQIFLRCCSCSGLNDVQGFSGTNDGQYLFPLYITQCDPDHQLGTNARVLSYLLQPENGQYMCMARENGEHQSTREFLEILTSQRPEIRVLLDVGAQMLELQNRQLAQAWLDICPDASAAIYFNEDDELTVLARDGIRQLLVSSPFAQQIDQCVVYLDDAHTRGTDIKFPSGFRAAVTLGPKVTKDRLAQGVYILRRIPIRNSQRSSFVGCMRMRKLGHDHSIMFFAPLGVDRHIRSMAGKGPQDSADTMDILHWAIRGTCDEIQKRAPDWAQQGVDHTSRYAAWSGFCEGQMASKVLSDEWLQPEAKRLEDLYGHSNTLESSVPAIPAIRQRCEELGILSLCNASMDEEQEREIVHEVEREQTDRPPRVPKIRPATHSIHQDVVAFIKTGIIPADSPAFRPAFESLDATSAASNEVHIWSSSVLVTVDFEKTVKPSKAVDLSKISELSKIFKLSKTAKSSKKTVESLEEMDNFLRPVQWIVSGKMTCGDPVQVVLSPPEASHLIPDIRSSNNVRLHLYTPRITKSMKPCNPGLYCIPAAPTRWTIPSHLMDQVNMFAGQLYLNDYETYIRVCRFLCVYARDLEGEEDIEVGHDGFIAPRNRPRHMQNTHTFQKSPLPSLKALMSCRRKGIRFAQTHMGRLLDGKLLSEGDFDGCGDVRLIFLSLFSRLYD